MRKLSSINFNYTYRLQLVIVIRNYFDKNLIYPEVQGARIQIKKKKFILTSSQFTEYIQHQVLY